MYLRGRSSELAAIAQAPDGALILAGDSGVGKSELLRAIDTIIDADPGGLVSEIYDVSGVDDGLQSAIARGLGDCVRTHHERHPGDLEIWARMADIVRSATTEGARKAGTIIVEAAYGVVADKLGQDTADVIKAVVSDVLQSAHAGFDARLGGLIAADVAVELNTIATEIASWCGSRLVVRIDRGELLSGRDITLLRAIGTLRNPGYLVVVAMSTADAIGADTVGLLQRSGINAHSIGPLGYDAVAAWLDDAGVDSTKWATIEHLTNGYPLFLPDAIRLANDGAPLVDIATSQRFVALQQYAWEQLTEAQRIAAGKLAIFADPPPGEFLCSYLATDVHQLRELISALRGASIFVETSTGEWFHDRRRSYIWRTALAPEQRKAIAADAYDSVDTWMAAHHVIGSWVYASLPAIIREVDSVDLSEYHRSLLQLTDTELSILWALIEMSEPDGSTGDVADTNAAALWAERRHGPLEGAVAAFEHLNELSMTVSVANEHASVTGAVIPNSMALAALIGEIEHRFAVHPIRHLASTVFDTVVRAHIPTFKIASYAANVSGLRAHRKTMETLYKNDRTLGSIDRMIALGLTVEADRIPVSITLVFASLDDREAAIAAIRTAPYRGDVKFGPTFELPPKRVRWHGIVDALRDREAEKHRNVASADDLVDLTRQRAAVEGVIAQHIPVHEAAAFGLDRSRRYLVQADESATSWVVVEIEGGAGGTADLLTKADVSLFRDDPIRELRLREIGVLDEGERISRVIAHWNRDGRVASPLLDVASDIEKAGKAYNRGLPRIQLPDDAEALRRALIAERERTTRLNIRLSDAGVPGPEISEDSTTIEYGHGEWLGADFRVWTASTLVVADGAGEMRVTRVSELTDRLRHAVWGDGLELLGIADAKQVRGGSHGDAGSIIGGMLGFNQEDVRFPMILRRSIDGELGADAGSHPNNETAD